MLKIIQTEVKKSLQLKDKIKAVSQNTQALMKAVSVQHKQLVMLERQVKQTESKLTTSRVVKAVKKARTVTVKKARQAKRQVVKKAG